MAAIDDIKALQEQPRWQVRITPESGSPFALDGVAHQTEAAAIAARDAYAGEGVAEVIRRNAFDVLTVAESDAMVQTHRDERATAALAAAQAEVAAMDVALQTATGTERTLITTLRDRAAVVVTQQQATISAIALEKKRQEILTRGG